MPTYIVLLIQHRAPTSYHAGRRGISKRVFLESSSVHTRSGSQRPMLCLVAAQKCSASFGSRIANFRKPLEVQKTVKMEGAA